MTQEATMQEVRRLAAMECVRLPFFDEICRQMGNDPDQWCRRCWCAWLLETEEAIA